MVSILKGVFNIKDYLHFPEVGTEGVQQEEASDGTAWESKSQDCPGEAQWMVCVHLNLRKCL